jgi:signal transduction histidine kinase
LLSIFVEDNGIGIAPEDLERVLAPFGRVGSPYTSREQGTGLGLYITRILIELHGGTLTIESEMGRGTRVAARFPAERVVPYRV